MKEIPLKQWRAEEATILGISIEAVTSRLYRLGKYPDMPKRYVNRRIVFVPADYHPMPPERPQHGEQRLNEFCLSEMQRLNMRTPVAVYARIKRGWYGGRIKLRTLNRSTVYVRFT